MESKTEFDRYAQNYEELLRDSARDGFAPSGEFFHRRKWILIADFLRRHRISVSNQVWLDVGCGKAELLAYGRPLFGRVVGCDLSGEMVRDARGIEVHLQTDPDVLPFQDASVDFVTAVCVYHHVEEVHRVPLTQEICRVLRPKGIFCMIEHNPINPVTRLIVSRCPVDVNAHLLTAKRSRHYSDKAGLRHMELQYFLYLPEKYYDNMGGLERVFKKLPLGGQYAAFAQK